MKHESWATVSGFGFNLISEWTILLPKFINGGYNVLINVIFIYPSLFLLPQSFYQFNLKIKILGGILSSLCVSRWFWPFAALCCSSVVCLCSSVRQGVDRVASKSSQCTLFNRQSYGSPVASLFRRNVRSPFLLLQEPKPDTVFSSVKQCWQQWYELLCSVQWEMSAIGTNCERDSYSGLFLFPGGSSYIYFGKKIPPGNVCWLFCTSRFICEVFGHLIIFWLCLWLQSENLLFMYCTQTLVNPSSFHLGCFYLICPKMVFAHWYFEGKLALAVKALHCKWAVNPANCFLFLFQEGQIIKATWVELSCQSRFLSLILNIT